MLIARQSNIQVLMWPLYCAVLLLTSCGGTGASSTATLPSPTPQPVPSQPAAQQSLSRWSWKRTTPTNR